MVTNSRFRLAIILLTLCLIGCSSPDEDKPSSESAADRLASDFDTVQTAIKTAACGELAFRFDIPLSEKLLASSFESWVAYRESLGERISGTAVLEKVLGSTRERAAAELGRVIGKTDERLTQYLRDQGGGDAEEAARVMFQEMGCPT